MHLLALLIATVLSTEFVPVSNTPCPFKITSEKYYRNTEAAATISIQQIDQTTAKWTETVTILLTKTSTAPSVLTGGYAMTGDSEETEVYTTTATVDLATDLTPLTAESTIYVWVVQNSVASPALVTGDPATITITDKWWMTYDAVDEDTKTLKTVTVTGPKTAWAAASNTITVHLSHQVETTPGTATWKAEKDSINHDTGVYTIGDIPIKNVPFDATTGLYAYVSFTPATANSPTWETAYVQVPVAEAVVRFTLNPALTDTTVARDTLPDFVIAQNGGENWNTGKPILVTLSIDATHKKVVFVAPVETVYTVTAFDMKQLGRRLKNDKLTIAVEYDAGGSAPSPSAGVPLKKAIEIPLVGDVPAVAFQVTAPAKIELPAMETFDVTVKEGLSGRSNAWSGTIKLFLSLDERAAPTVAGVTWLATALNAGEYKTTTPVAASAYPGIEEATKLFAWVMHTPSGGANANEEILPTPVPITIEYTEPTTFTVEPNFVPWATPLTTVKAKIAPSDATVLTTTHYVSLAYTAPAPANVDPVKIILTKEGNDFFIPATSIADLGILEANLPATITGTVFTTADVKVGETFTLTVDKVAFTVTPANIDLAVETLPDIVVTQRAGATKWTEKVFLHMAKAPTLTPLTTAVAKEATFVTASTPSAWKLAAFDVKASFADIKKGDKIYLYVATGATTGADGTIVADCVGEIAIIDTPAAESTFTLATTQLTWADPLKTTKIEITPLPAETHGWPVAEDKIKVKFAIPAAASNADPAPVEITVEVEGDAGKEKWFIPADKVLTTLVPTEPTADVPLEVTASLDAGTTYLKHKVTFTIKKKEDPKVDAAMGVSPLASLLVALIFLFVKLF